VKSLIVYCLLVVGMQQDSAVMPAVSQANSMFRLHPHSLTDGRRKLFLQLQTTQSGGKCYYQSGPD